MADTTAPTATAPTDLTPATGKVTAVADGKVMFSPTGTNYDLHLIAPGYGGPVGKVIRGVVRVRARKVWTVPSGGNFITPLFGSPRIIQGRVKALDDRWLIVHAGVPIYVELPDNDNVYDLAHGAITAGALVNVTALPGAGFDFQHG